MWSRSMTRLTAEAGSSPSLHPESAGDVAEDVLDLVAEDDQDHDHHHRDEDQDQGVLDHSLTFVIAEYFEESLEDERKFHGLSIKTNASECCHYSGQPPTVTTLS